MADNPGNVLHALVKVARAVCEAQSVGIDLDSDRINGTRRTHAVAGLVARSADGTIVRDQSPALLIPFYDHSLQIGTIWIVGRAAGRPFDNEDERIVGVLTTLASAGWQLWHASELTTANDRRKDEFLATLAHELRNPLSAIAAAAAVLQQRTQPPSASQAIGVIARQTQHMSRLIGDLFDIARIVSGKLALQTQSIDLCIIAADAVETRRAQIERRRQVLTLDVCEEPLMVEGDPVRLQQVISNLVDNASKYTPEHGDISVTVSCNDLWCSVAVSDSGAGIPAEELQRIFLPFTQLQKSGGSGGGLGLGLALVQTLVALHGGDVGVTSAGTGQGSCFTLRLPAAESRPRPDTRNAGSDSCR